MRHLTLSVLSAALLAACGDKEDPEPFEPEDSGRVDPYADDSDYVVRPVETGVPFPWDTAVVDTDDTGLPLPDTDTDGCPPDYVVDCLGQCFSETLLGDGFCDNGPAPAPDFASCDDFSRDGGDCPEDTDAPPDTDPPDDTDDTDDTDVVLPECLGPFEVRDCNDACYPSTWVGDGRCDDGTTEPYGSPDFHCGSFDFDGGDCASPS